MSQNAAWMIVAAGCLFAGPVAIRADEPGRPMLHLRNGDFISGTLIDSDDPAVLVWQADGFASPFHFPLTAVHSLRYPGAPTGVAGPYFFELAGGDLLAGKLRSLDAERAVLEVAGSGTLTLNRSALLRFYRASETDIVYSGPRGLDGWTMAGGENSWREEGTQLRTDIVGAAIGRNDRPPPQVRYDLELAWADKPDFEFRAGLSQHVEGRTAFRLETWGDELVITRESDSQAEIAVLQKIAPGDGSVALSVLLDEARGQILVYSGAGEVLADFTVPPDTKLPKPQPVRPPLLNAAANVKPKPPLPTGLLLTNRRGSVSIQRLAVRRWSGIAPQLVEAGQASIHLSDGKTQTGEIRAFDAESDQLEVFANGKLQKIDAGLIQQVVLRSRDEGRPGPVLFLLTNGHRISGEIKQLQSDVIVIHSPQLQDALRVPVKELQAVLARNSGSKPESHPTSQAVLRITGTVLHGSLQPAKQAENTCLVFQPAGSTVASPLTTAASGSLRFREAAAVPQPKPQTAPQANAVGQMVNGLKTMLGNTKPATMRPKPPGDCLLHLRTGDTLPCRVQFIDERGVNFTSTLSKAGFVAHDRIRALELRLDAIPVKIEQTRFDRLLTLPRMQRDNPPEQLIRSLQGDYLRGRLVAMNDKELEIEMRLEAKKIPRDQVTRILWLHPDESAKATVAKPAEPAPPDKPAGIRVQAVPANAHRLTFFAQELTGNTLSGRSELLGECQADISQLEQLLIGAEIEKAATSLAFNQWRLRAAPEPLPESDPDADPGRSDGMESVLVGKPAPAIELDLLAGGKFRLADCKDKVVVLDFWASWCGPCLQAMPQIDKVKTEFADRNVAFVAINLGESSDQIKTVLSRLKIKTDVALDADGRVAERYGANEIPQTVIVGRNGKVARLFVGAGSRFDEKLRQAIKAVLTD
jgi:thiol-disulfide isomerase/thioredoxin